MKMKKLYHSISAAAIILMSSQAYAVGGNPDNSDETKKAQITRQLIREGKSDEEIASYFQTLGLSQNSNSQTTSSISNVNSNTSVADKNPTPVAITSSVMSNSNTPINSISENANEMIMPMADIRNSRYRAEFDRIFDSRVSDFTNLSGVKSKNSAFLHYLNNDENVRFNPSEWYSYQMSGLQYDRFDRKMIHAQEQIRVTSAMIYKDILKGCHIRIKDLEQIGLAETRSSDELMRHLFSYTGHDDNAVLNTTEGFMKVWNAFKRNT